MSAALVRKNQAGFCGPLYRLGLCPVGTGGSELPGKSGSAKGPAGKRKVCGTCGWIPRGSRLETCLFPRAHSQHTVAGTCRHTQRTHTQVHTRTEARAHSPREGCKGDACPRAKTLQAGSRAWCRAGAEAQDAARGLRTRGGGAGPHDCASTQQDAYSGDVQDGASAALPSPPEVSRSRVTHFSSIFICLCQSLACN